MLIATPMCSYKILINNKTCKNFSTKQELSADSIAPGIGEILSVQKVQMELQTV